MEDQDDNGWKEQDNNDQDDNGWKYRSWDMEAWESECGTYSIDVYFGSKELAASCGQDTCPILMEPFGVASVDGVPNSTTMEVYKEPREVARLPCCGKMFNPVALAVHFMLHGMRCPMCRSGHGSLLSVNSLAACCRDGPASDIAAHVERMRKEMRREEAEEEFEGVDEMDIDLVPVSELMTDIALLRQWDFVYPNLQLQAILHMSPSVVLKALESLNRHPFESGLPYWTQCSTGIHLFLNIVFEHPEIDPPRRFTVQRNQCRKISRALTTLHPASISFGLCYADDDDSLTQIARSRVISLQGSNSSNGQGQGSVQQGSIQQGSVSSDLTFETEERTVRAGTVRMAFMEGKGRSVEGITCEVRPEDIITRLIHGRIMAFQHVHGILETHTISFVA
jgi:hypothetical protein